MKNPYTPPGRETGPSSNSHSVQFRVFRGPAFSFKLSAKDFRNDVRNQVQQSIDAEIGANNVISINEQVESLGGFSIVVWYRK